MSRADYYPEHDRTSCSDADPSNAEATGSHGCARCTAILMDKRDELLELGLKVADKLDAAIRATNERASRYLLEEAADLAVQFRRPHGVGGTDGR